MCRTIFITIVLLGFAYGIGSTCRRASPTEASGCANYDSTGSACCFFSSITKNMCYSIDDNTRTSTTSMVVDGVTYKVDCSKSTSASGTVTTDTKYGGTCAVNPTAFSDCSKHLHHQALAV